MTKQKKAKTNNSFFGAVKTLSRSIREYKKPSLLAPLFVAMEVVLECLIPWIMSLLLEAINFISGNPDGANPSLLVKKILFFLSSDGKPELLSTILFFGAILIVCAFLSLICGFLSGRFCAIASSGFAKNLRKDMYYKIQDFSFSNIDKFSSSSLVTRMTTDVTNVEMSYMMIIRTAVRSPFMLIFSLVMSFVINARMALIFLCTTPILAVGLALIMRKAIPFFTKIFKKYDKLNESVEENIKGMRVVKSYVREDYEKEKFNKASNNVKNDFTRAEKIIALNTPLMNFCVYGGLIAIYIVGSMLIINSKNTLLKWTELQSFMSYSFQMLMSLMMLSMIFVTLIISTASAKRIAEVLNEQSTITSKENAKTEIKDGSISFENVNFRYNGNSHYALTDINLKIESGQTIGIIGSTGSSKTTLISLIPRLYDVESGCVKVGGVDVRDYDIESLRNSVSVVLQKNVLFSGSIRDNMKWGDSNATDEEIIKALELSQIGNFELDKYIEQGGANVSGGQKQRLCIARALLKKPKILILDDSTSAVDTKTDALIRKSLKEYIPETTKIIIAQRIASIQEADVIVIIDGGRIIACGSHDELIRNNEIYQELYYSQNNAESNKVKQMVQNEKAGK
ncbi:MAG: ABC transporter ATP-binding protein [Clostridiales bacterium]|nr:ABC transporter ATP-binding protein [Clostridiales bacterium]